VYWLADTAETDHTEISNNDSDWRLDSCGEAVVTADGADFEDKLDNSVYDASEPADEGTGGWAENIAGGGCEAGASGWLDGDFKSINTNDDQWNGTTDSLVNVDLHSHRFTASIVVNTGNKERCELILNWSDVIEISSKSIDEVRNNLNNERIMALEHCSLTNQCAL